MAFQSLPWWGWLFLFIFGLVLGSFFNVCIYRIPREIFWKEARSHCPHCEALIPWWLNIPLLSWLWLRGKARCCGGRISWRYPLVELVTGIAVMALYSHWPFFYLTPDHYWAFDLAQCQRFIHALIFASFLGVCSVIDYDHQIIPDVLSLPMAALGPLVALWHPELTWQSSLLGVALGAGILYGVAWLYFAIRREAGMGMGDVKLLAAIGGWLGYQALMPVFFIACLVGAVCGIGVIIVSRTKNFKSAIPFGPFLSLGAFLYLWFGGRLWEWLLFTVPQN